MEDIAPGLLEALLEDYEKNKENSELIQLIKSKLEDGSATYADANEYAIELGDILANAYAHNISSDILPDGRMYYNIADRVIRPTMVRSYDDISNATVKIQQSLNEKAGIGIKAIKPELNQDRIKGIVNKISNAKFYDDVAWVLDAPIKNYAQSIVDDSVKVNTEFHGKAGMTPKIIRKSAGGCCDWCVKQAGEYRYPDVPKDVYRRHNYCRCTVDYDPGTGKVQNVHSKQWKEADEELERRKTIGLSETSKEELERRKTIGLTETTAEELERRKSIGLFDEEQEYRPINRSETVVRSIRGRKNIAMRQVTNSTYQGDMLISDSVELKPKQMHNIEMSLNNAVKIVGYGDNLPKCMIISSAEMQTGAVCSYNATSNILYIDSTIGDLDKLLELQKDMACPDNPISTYVHELLHWKEAQNYLKKKSITNQAEYLSDLRSYCRKKLDNLSASGYNIFEISKYARKMYHAGYYDETWTEYLVLELLGEGD